MPVITLKNLKYAEFASHETPCFQATIYCDGAALCTAENDGHGGADLYHPRDQRSRQDIADVDAALKATATRPNVLEDWEKKLWDEGYRPGLEETVHRLVTEQVERRRLKRLLARHILLASKEHGTRSLSVKYNPAVRKAVAARYPGECILNTLPFEEAFRLYQKCTKSE